MTKRSLTFLIIIILVATIGIFGYFYFSQPESTDNPGENNNFLSRFNPFGGTTNPPTTSPDDQPTITTPPADNTPTETPETVKLRMVSSMPVAGYGIYKKERFKDVPVVVPPTMVPDAPASTTITSTTTTNAPAAPSSTTVTTTTTTVPAKPVKPTPPPTEFVSAVRYVARTSGNIYQTFADKIDERKFSATVIPKVYEAYFGNNGESVVMRYLKADDNTIQTFIGIIPKEVLGGDTTENNEVKGTFLPDNIQDASLSPDKSKLFYLMNVGESMIGTVSGLLDNKKVQVFDSAFTEWLSFWPNAKLITLTTKPSALIPGYMYAVDPNTKKLSSMLSGINGLTTLGSPDGKLVLFSGNDLSLNLYNISTKSSSSIGVSTLPEKCAWNSSSTRIYCAVPKSIPVASYPDDWYKGKVSFSDQIWRIDVATGTTTVISDPATVSTTGEIEGVKLGVDEEENYLFFVNKKDSYLWELGLK